MGSVQSPLAFEAGRTTVEVSVFSVSNLKDNETAVRVHTTVAQNYETGRPLALIIRATSKLEVTVFR